MGKDDFKLIWAWFSRGDAPNKPTQLETFKVEVTQHRDDVYGKNHSSTPLHNVTVLSGDNEDGIKDGWIKTNNPLLTLRCNGNGYEVTRHSWGGSDAPQWDFKLGYADAQYLLIALKAMNEAYNKQRGSSEIYYRYGRRDLKSVLADLLPEPRPAEGLAMDGLAAQIERDLYEGDSKESLARLAKDDYAPKDMGKALLDLEKIREYFVKQGLQKGDILALVNSDLDVHAPGCREVYEDDGSSPVFYYGPAEGLAKDET